MFKIRLSTTLFFILILKCLNLKTQSSLETAVSTKPLLWKMEKSWRKATVSGSSGKGGEALKGRVCTRGDRQSQGAQGVGESHPPPPPPRWPLGPRLLRPCPSQRVLSSRPCSHPWKVTFVPQS